MHLRNARKIHHLKTIIFIILLPVLFGCSIYGRLDTEFNARGMEAGKAGLYEQALEWFNKAIAQNPNESNYFMNRAIACHSLKLPTQALEDYGSVKWTP